MHQQKPAPWQQRRGNLAAIYGKDGFTPETPAYEQSADVRFLDALKSAGLEPGDLIPDGQIHRCKAPGDNGSRQSGWYVFYPDEPAAGAYGSWRDEDTTHKWCARAIRELSLAERAAYDERMARAKAERDKAQERRRSEARKRAAEIIGRTRPAPADHPYLKSKAIGANGALVDDKGLLVLPMRDEHGTLQSLQTIDPTGKDKRFLAGGRKKGCFFLIGEPTHRILITEGFATGATVHEATGEATACAFDAGNLEPVAKALKITYPSSQILICADNDHKGLSEATKAANATGARIIAPDPSTEPGTDWNDIAARHGYDAIRKALSETSGRFKPLTVEETLAEPAPSWRIVGLLPSRGVGMVWGAPGSGKTFAALDMCASIVRGERWFGCRVKPAPVVYIAAEGVLRWRLAAYLQHHEIEPNTLQSLRVIQSSINLLKPGPDLPELFEELDRLAGEIGAIGMVVIDTLNRAMPGGNENSSEDVSAVLSAAKEIERRLKCLVLFIHHSGKDETRGSRGHSSLKGAMDAELVVRREGDIRSVFAEKVRDDKDGMTVGMFRLKRVELGPMSDHDPDAEPGEMYTSCALAPIADIPKAGDGQNINPSDMRALDLLRAKYLECGLRLKQQGRDPSGAKIEWKEWKEQAREAEIWSGHHSNFTKISNRLASAGFIIRESAHVYLVPSDLPDSDT